MNPARPPQLEAWLFGSCIHHGRGSQQERRRGRGARSRQYLGDTKGPGAASRSQKRLGTAMSSQEKPRGQGGARRSWEEPAGTRRNHAARGQKELGGAYKRNCTCVSIGAGANPRLMATHTLTHTSMQTATQIGHKPGPEPRNTIRPRLPMDGLTCPRNLEHPWKKQSSNRCPTPGCTP